LIEPGRVGEAAEEILAAALLGEGWAEGLQLLSEATQAGGATLMRLRRGKTLGCLSSVGWADADAAMIAGHAPASHRRFFPDHVFGGGFLGDTDVWPDEELRGDPYFQEFLRPRGVFYHGKAQLAADADARVSLSLKRLLRFGPYEPADIAALNRVLPTLRTAVRVARRTLEAEAAGLVRAVHRWGDPVFELDAWGRVRRAHGGDNAGRHGIVVRGGRLAANERRRQAPLDRAIAAAVGDTPQSAIVPVANRDGERRFLQVVPVAGRARDVFVATAALIVVVEPGRDRSAPLAATIRQALELTEREAAIAGLLSQGLSLPVIAARLGLGLGTVRNHLKSIFGKTGTQRQGELVALLCALQR